MKRRWNGLSPCDHKNIMCFFYPEKTPLTVLPREIKTFVFDVTISVPDTMEIVLTETREANIANISILTPPLSGKVDKVKLYMFNNDNTYPVKISRGCKLANMEFTHKKTKMVSHIIPWKDRLKKLKRLNEKGEMEEISISDGESD